MNKTYYVITVNTVPVGVTEHWSRALAMKKEISTSTKEAEIVPVMALQGAFDFEDPTNPEVSREEFDTMSDPGLSSVLPDLSRGDS